MTWELYKRQLKKSKYKKKITFLCGSIGCNIAKKFAPLFFIQEPPDQITNWIPANFFFCKLISTIFFFFIGVCQCWEMRCLINTKKWGIETLKKKSERTSAWSIIKKFVCVDYLKGSFSSWYVCKICLTCSSNHFWFFR